MSDFNGAEINGKKFPFVRVTIAKQERIIQQFKPTIRTAFMERWRPEGNNKRMWKRVRSLAFEKTGLWKWLRIVPEELRCSNMSLKLAGELQARFFSSVAAEVKEHDEHLRSANLLPTANTPAK